MHICFITDHYPKPGEAIGGIGIFTQTLGRALVKNGVQVTVVGAGYKSAAIENDEGVTVIRIARSKWPFLKFVQQVWNINSHIKKAHRANSIDIIECSEVGLALIRKIKGIKFLIRLHGGHHFFSHYQNQKLVPKTVWQEKQSFKKADALLACSNFVNQQTAKYLHYNPATATVIYNSINVLDTKAYKVDVLQYSILFCGTLCEKKGVRQLVMAFSKVKAAIPQARLVLAGKPQISSDGISYIEILKPYISPDLSASITFIGPVPHYEIYNHMAAAHVCVYPSHMEALPMVWLESMALGKPVVASELGPGPEVITHGKDGLLCNPHNPDDIAEKLIEMLQNNALADNCGKAAKETVRQKFNIDTTVQQNIHFYKKLIDATTSSF
jgi:glycosyltransferase involved in cell wall biosynthesis